MLESLIEFDTEVFLALNGWGSSIVDGFFLFITNKYVWFPAYAALIVYLFWKTPNRVAIAVIFGILLAFTFADIGSVHLFKNPIARSRPCHVSELQDSMRLVARSCGGGFGFISSHASNAFALAFCFFTIFKSWKFRHFFFIWAALVAYSRVYIGVHYPADILAGSAYGLLCGYLPSRYIISRALA